jgi:pyrroline-5-carboxylate reductase
MMRRVVVIGAGHMGTAIILGLLQNHWVDLYTVDPNESRRSILKERHDLNVASSPENIRDDDILVLAIPPQTFSEFAKSTSLGYNRSGPVISVMAGITAATISKLLGTNQVIRAIPNTPSEIFQGMTVFCASPDANAENLAVAENILQSFGKTIRVTDESLIDHATALCGGGPAFVAYFANALQDFAMQSGFNRTDSALMVAQILRGTVDLLDATGKSAAQVCNEVMTPQGTTERGISHFKENNLELIVRSGLAKSSARSRELGRLFNQ